MVKDRRKKVTTINKKTIRKAEKIGKVNNTNEEWIKKQTFKPAPLKPEVQVPSDSYEEWIRKEVKKRLQI